MLLLLISMSCGDALSRAQLTAHGVISVSSYVAPRETGAASLPDPELALAVSGRESILGCHSFDRFHDARWETFFLFEREYARAWRLRVLAASAASRSQTRRATVVEFGGLPAQPNSTIVVLALLDERRIKIASLIVCGCDVHPLPPWHAGHQGFDVMVERLFGSFLADSSSRRDELAGGSLAEQHSPADMLRWNRQVKASSRCRQRFESQRTLPLLCACAVLVQTLPATDSLAGAQLLGADAPDIGDWMLNGGERRDRLPAAQGADDRWLTDSAMWLPDRLCAYNATLLAPQLERLGRVAGTLVDAPRTWSAVVCEARLAAVRDNEVVAFVDSAHEGLVSQDQSGRARRLFDPAVYAGVSRGWLRPYALGALAEQASPDVCLGQLAILARAGLTIDLYCEAAEAVLRPEHLPASELDSRAWERWAGEPITRNGSGVVKGGPLSVRELLRPLLVPLLALAGHRLARTNATHAVFVHLPTSGSRPLLSMRGDANYFRQAHWTPWLELLGEPAINDATAHSSSTVHFAGARLGARAVFLARAIGRTQPVTLALPLAAIVHRVEAPIGPGGKRPERSAARVWQLLAAQHCDSALRVREQLEAQLRARSSLEPAAPRDPDSRLRHYLSGQHFADALRAVRPLHTQACSTYR
jgi:hypothetical protein